MSDGFWGAFSVFTSFATGYLLAKIPTGGKPVAKKARQTPVDGWVTLPSGLFYRDDSGTIGFVATSGDGAGYWWISRQGRTIIEGPTQTLDAGKNEVLKALREFGRG